MTTHLEDELVAGMREQATGLLPPVHLVDRAARRHRRRRAGLAAGTAAVGVAAALAVAVVALGTAPAPTLRGGQEVRDAPPTMLTVAQISHRALAALAADDIEHVMTTASQNGVSYRDEAWYDLKTRSARHHSVRPSPGGPVEDSWDVYRDGQVVVTYVNQTTRTWWTTSREVAEGRVAGPSAYPPDDLRAALSRSDSYYRLVGNEKIGDVAVVHLRNVRVKGGSDDIWVDADTYRAVRRVTVKASARGDLRVQRDFDWRPRTNENLAPLTVTIPDGFTQVDPSESAVPLPPQR